MKNTWINTEERLPEKEGYYTVKYENGETDEKWFRIRPSKGIRGFVVMEKVVQWKAK